MRIATNYWSVAFHWVICLHLAIAVLTDFPELPVELQFSISRKTANTKKLNGLFKRQNPAGAVELELTESQTFYHAMIRFGSEEEPVSLLIDTGAVATWVISKGVKCYSSPSIQVDPRFKRRSETEHQEIPSLIQDSLDEFGSLPSDSDPEFDLPETDPRKCTANGVFDSSKSSTFKVFEDMGPYHVKFQDNTFANGTWGQDTLLLGDVRVENVPFALVQKTDNTIGILGLGSDNSKNVLTNDTSYPASFQGFPQILKSQGLIKRAVFSLFLDKSAERGGSVLFGAVDHAKYYGKLQTVPFVNYYDQYSDKPLFFDVGLDSISVKEPGKETIDIRVGRSALLDSGGTLCSFPKDILSPFAEALDGVWHKEMGLYQIDRAKVKLKQVSFWISSIKINVPVIRLLVRIKGKDYLGVSLVEHDRLVLGEEFLRSAYVVFDTERNEVSMAQAKYSSQTDWEVVTDNIPRAVRASHGGILESGSDSNVSFGSTSSSDIRRVRFLEVPHIIEPKNEPRPTNSNDTTTSLLSHPLFPKMGVSALKAMNKPNKSVPEIHPVDTPSVADLQNDLALETIEEALSFLTAEDSNELSLEELEFLAEGLPEDETSEDYLGFSELLDAEMKKSSPALKRVRKGADLKFFENGDKIEGLHLIGPGLNSWDDGLDTVEEMDTADNSDESMTETIEHQNDDSVGHSETENSLETGEPNTIEVLEENEFQITSVSSVPSTSESNFASSTRTEFPALTFTSLTSVILFQTTRTSLRESAPLSALISEEPMFSTSEKKQRTLMSATFSHSEEVISILAPSSGLRVSMTSEHVKNSNGSLLQSIDSFRLESDLDTFVLIPSSEVTSMPPNISRKPKVENETDIVLEALIEAEKINSRQFSNVSKPQIAFHTHGSPSKPSLDFRLLNTTPGIHPKENKSPSGLMSLNEGNDNILKFHIDPAPSSNHEISLPESSKIGEVLQSATGLVQKEIDFSLPSFSQRIEESYVLEANSEIITSEIQDILLASAVFRLETPLSTISGEVSSAALVEGIGNRLSGWPGKICSVVFTFTFVLLF